MRMEGSFQNRMGERATIGQPTPEIGMGATELLYSDRHAMTIVSVERYGSKGGWIIGVTRDDCTVTNGPVSYGDHVEYEYASNFDGHVDFFRASEPDARWQAVRKNPETGRWNMAGSTGLKIGVREEYRDPHF